MPWRSQQPLEISCCLCRMGCAYICGWKEGHGAEQGLDVPPQNLSVGHASQQSAIQFAVPTSSLPHLSHFRLYWISSLPRESNISFWHSTFIPLFSDRDTSGALFFWPELPPLSTKYLLSPFYHPETRQHLSLTSSCAGVFPPQSLDHCSSSFM